MNKRDYTVLGLMSGTSCDGLDLMLCRIFFEGGWKYQVIKFVTYNYSLDEITSLKQVNSLSAMELMRAHAKWGNIFGEKAMEFLKANADVKVDFIASHGHTVFHQPNEGFTFQMGLGANIAVKTQLPVVCDFRTTDIAWGGQGAPLVPLGDALFFEDYDFCVNLGGFINVSYAINKQRYAFDVCPMNIVLNDHAQSLGAAYDKSGQWASEGKVHEECLAALNALEYYLQPPPKSLGVEWVVEHVFPLFRHYNLNSKDALATMVEHSAIQLSYVLRGWVGKSLFTGGGVFNTHFMERLKSYLPEMELVVPELDLINGKEALIFALLGVLRWEMQLNSISSVTGAERSSTGGTLYYY